MQVKYKFSLVNRETALLIFIKWGLPDKMVSHKYMSPKYKSEVLFGSPHFLTLISNGQIF
jgi:hypothetical protein